LWSRSTAAKMPPPPVCSGGAMVSWCDGVKRENSNKIKLEKAKTIILYTFALVP